MWARPRRAEAALSAALHAGHPALARACSPPARERPAAAASRAVKAVSRLEDEVRRAMQSIEAELGM